ncbi:hypothetical protein [Xanthomonas cerealis]|uniref:hypothetical protein n=1 Tax=Xanthomonas cerealis TaxID=3390025 RepID=UPI000AF673F0|nr:hypothetical protein [Xanthomonas translucens]
MPLQHWLMPPHAWVPNHPFLPVLLYRQEEGDGDAAGFERRFAAHGWPPQWRDGIYDYHQHSTAHEVLDVASGSARLVIGGPGGTDTTLATGDALLLPAGARHRDDPTHRPAAVPTQRSRRRGATPASPVLEDA